MPSIRPSDIFDRSLDGFLVVSPLVEPHVDGETLPNTFYNLSFSYQERLDLLDEIATLPDFSDLPVSIQEETAQWIRSVTDSSYDVTIRTFEEVLKMREAMDMPIEQQVEAFCLEFDCSESTYYNLMSEIKSERGDSI